MGVSQARGAGGGDSNEWPPRNSPQIRMRKGEMEKKRWGNGHSERRGETRRKKRGKDKSPHSKVSLIQGGDGEERGQGMGPG